MQVSATVDHDQFLTLSATVVASGTDVRTQRFDVHQRVPEATNE